MPLPKGLSDKLHQALKSKTHRKILIFFAENQGSIDTPRGISAWINEGIQGVRMALEDLVRIGVLRAHRTTSTIGYSCALTQAELQKALSAQP